ncbi:MAG: isoprenyl transferase [Deltaproteobacteria bacterium]|nr:isoprenyl transferase [Deltaproteobacteria bacterium]MBW2658717.1 isoprenyl transferase [Deltaproteobacteria bacterium]
MVPTTVVDVKRLPQHVAIIMDGNGRWAKSKKKPRLFGHKVGADSVRDIVEIARKIDIKVLTLYAFSSENWDRPVQEVSGLMSILKRYLESELPRMLNNGIRLMSIGDRNRLPDGVRKTLENVIDKTSGNSELILNLALSYGGRDEIVRAMKNLSRECVAGKRSVESITSEVVSSYLDTADLPDPDLLIRTGGEFRLSNFMLWQVSYAEVYFTDIMWPEFRKDEFLGALSEFQSRERRFGRTGDQLHSE